MTTQIQNLLNLAKVDNSRETFDKLAKALEVATDCLIRFEEMDVDFRITAASHDALQKIKTIAEKIT